MSSYILPWVSREDGSLVVEWFCSEEGDSRFFIVDSVEASQGSCLLARVMTCTHCREPNFMSRPLLQPPPPGYAVYNVKWESPIDSNAGSGPAAHAIRLVANSRRMAYEVSMGSWRGWSMVPGARCFIDGEEYVAERPEVADDPC